MGGEKQKTDNWFERLEKGITGAISTFAAFLFLLFGAGAIYGAFLARESPLFLAIPLLLGVLAYYSRDFAIVVLALFLVFFFFLL